LPLGVRRAIRIADRGYVLVNGRITLSANSSAELKGSDLVRRLISASIELKAPEPTVDDPAGLCISGVLVPARWQRVLFLRSKGRSIEEIHGDLVKPIPIQARERPASA
jgi:hypothetical protein